MNNAGVGGKRSGVVECDRLYWVIIMPVVNNWFWLCAGPGSGASEWANEMSGVRDSEEDGEDSDGVEREFEVMKTYSCSNCHVATFESWHKLSNHRKSCTKDIVTTKFHGKHITLTKNAKVFSSATVKPRFLTPVAHPPTSQSPDASPNTQAQLQEFDIAVEFDLDMDDSFATMAEYGLGDCTAPEDFGLQDQVANGNNGVPANFRGQELCPELPEDRGQSSVVGGSGLEDRGQSPVIGGSGLEDLGLGIVSTWVEGRVKDRRSGGMRTGGPRGGNQPEDVGTNRRMWEPTGPWRKGQEVDKGTSPKSSEYYGDVQEVYILNAGGYGGAYGKYISSGLVIGDGLGGVELPGNQVWWSRVLADLSGGGLGADMVYDRGQGNVSDAVGIGLG
ncbi:hypothetical protein DFH29DRAFT_877972 [Suillus ampliporus]|nr:hypothetical protein DFH29DRAFT_877972 [Suillus ampliporus]